MRPALDPAGHRVPRTKPTRLLHTWRPHRQRPFALVLHLHQHESSCNLHLQYLAKNQSTQRCQSLITQGSDHPPVHEPHMVLILRLSSEGAEKSLMTVVSIRIVGNLKPKIKNKDTRLVILEEFSLNRPPRQQRQKCLLVFVKPTKIL
jgi:hypothetical protein